MKILTLTLKKKWFDMILSGEKKEEYREIKPYWQTRFLESDTINKNFDAVLFKNGYAKNAPSILIEHCGLWAGHGRISWGAPDKKVYIILLGSIIETKNI